MKKIVSFLCVALLILSFSVCLNATELQPNSVVSRERSDYTVRYEYSTSYNTDSYNEYSDVMEQNGTKYVIVTTHYTKYKTTTRDTYYDYNDGNSVYMGSKDISTVVVKTWKTTHKAYLN